MLPTRDTVDILNTMFTNNEFEWVELDLTKVPASTKTYIELIPDTVSIKMNKASVQGIYIFMLEHPEVKYLIHDPALHSHMWGDVKFENLNNNQALSSIWGKPNMKEILDKFDAMNKEEKNEKR